MSLISLPSKLFTKVTNYLSLQDLITLGDSHPRLCNLVYKNSKVWASVLLFSPADLRITDQFIQTVMPRITRDYGILELKMVDLPLSWAGYLMIFDQFAHSVHQIEIKASRATLERLAYHLSVFAGNLMALQMQNRIPITFREYKSEERQYADMLKGTQYVGYWLDGNREETELDDPPFEHLKHFNIAVSDGRYEDEESERAVRRLESVVSFLSGRENNNHFRDYSPQPTALEPLMRSNDSNDHQYYQPDHHRHDSINYNSGGSSSSSGNKRRQREEEDDNDNRYNNDTNKTKHTKHHESNYFEQPKQHRHHQLPPFSSLIEK